MPITLDIPTNFPLRGMVSGISDTDTEFDGRSDRYLEIGLSALRIIEGAYRDAPSPARILDLPCGHGPVTRILHARYPDAALVVSDIDASAVAFTAATFGAHGVACSEDFTTLDFGSQFDLIWVGSLLTQLPREQMARFLDFAVRHMHAQSRLVVTTHGAYAAEQLRAHGHGLPDALAAALLAEYRMRGYGFRGHEGQPLHGRALIDRGWLEDVLAECPLALQSYQPRGWDRREDAVVLRLREPSGRLWRRWRRRPRSVEAACAVIDPAPYPPPTSTDIAGFDEAFYLAAYPDVAAAVRDNRVPSGLAHFTAFGWRENRNQCDPARFFAARPRVGRHAYLGNGGFRRDARVDEMWSQDPEDEARENGQYWMAHPMVRARVNELATGNARIDAYDHLAELLRARGLAVPIRRAISLGCGFGALERDLHARSLLAEVDAYDLAGAAIAEAQRQAAAAGMTGLRFHVADLERIRLARHSLDVVVAHSSVHHVERLEALFAVVRRALRPEGLFHLNEFVGPTRFQWTERQIELVNHFLAGLPERLRRLPSGKPKEDLRRPTIEEMIAADPTEAVRSAEITDLLARDFDIIETRPLGGTLLHLALGGIAQNFDPASEGDAGLLAELFEVESRAMASGEIGSDFAVIVAAPRRDR